MTLGKTIDWKTGVSLMVKIRDNSIHVTTLLPDTSGVVVKW